MASPFTIFRRNQRAMMAFLCLVAMGAFVLVNPWNIGSNRDRGRSGHDIAVKTRFGDVREAELQNMVAARHGLARFLMELMVAAVETQFRKEFKPSSTEPKQQELELARELQQAQYLGQLRGQEVVQRFMRDGSGRPAEVEAMNTYILANKARELGMVVNDDTAKDFLRSLTGGVLQEGDLGRIVQNLRRLTHLNEDLLFGALTNELLANRLLNAILSDSRPELSPPAARRRRSR